MTSETVPTTMPTLWPTQLPNVAPGSVRVRLLFKYLDGKDGEKHHHEDVLWPEGWRLPAAGEAVQFQPGVGGFVEYVTWALDSALVIVSIR